MKSIKKFMMKLMVLSLAFIFVFAIGCGSGSGENAKHNDFIDTIGGVSETYKGEISEQEFETKEDAAEAYVMQQVVGSNDATVVNTESKGTLSSTEVNGLIPTEMQEGIESVEKIEVEYSEADATPYSEGANGAVFYDTLNTTKKVTVYIVKYENYFAYFTPAPVTGDTITKAYYNSVFDSEKYKNCTYDYDMTVSATTSGSYGGVSVSINMEMEISQLIKFTEDRIYLEMITSEVYSGIPGEEDEAEITEIYAYIENVDGDIKIFVKESAESTEWVEGNVWQIGVNSINDLMPFADQYLDYTYFTKTDYGFEVADENAERFIAETLETVEGAEGMDIDMIAKFYVANGVLSGMREDASVSVAQDGMVVTSEVVAEVTCTNYGTTVVERPFDIPTTVTSSQWEGAFDVAGDSMSYTVTMPNLTLEYAYDGDVLFCKQTGEDGVLLEYLYEEDGVYYEMEKINDGEWTSYEIEYTDYYEEVYGAIESFSNFSFSDFTYNATSKKYEAASVMMDDMELTNVKVYLEFGKVKTMEYVMNGASCSIALDYSEVELTLPVID